jgi:hypothetical protein
VSGDQGAQLHGTIVLVVLAALLIGSRMAH